MKIKTVLFDLDGTLLDRDSSLKAFAQAQYDRYRAHFAPAYTREAFVDRLISLDDNGRVWKDEVYRQLLQDGSTTDLTWQVLLKDYEEGFCRHCKAFPGLKAVVAELKAAGRRLGLVSNGPSPLSGKKFPSARHRRGLRLPGSLRCSRA